MEINYTLRELDDFRYRDKKLSTFYGDIKRGAKELYYNIVDLKKKPYFLPKTMYVSNYSTIIQGVLYDTVKDICKGKEELCEPLIELPSVYFKYFEDVKGIRIRINLIPRKFDYVFVDFEKPEHMVIKKVMINKSKIYVTLEREIECSFVDGFTRWK